MAERGILIKRYEWMKKNGAGVSDWEDWMRKAYKELKECKQRRIDEYGKV